MATSTRPTPGRWVTQSPPLRWASACLRTRPAASACWRATWRLAVSATLCYLLQGPQAAQVELRPSAQHSAYPPPTHTPTTTTTTNYTVLRTLKLPPACVRWTQDALLHRPLTRHQQTAHVNLPQTGNSEVAVRLREVDAMMRSRRVPLRLALRVRSYLSFVLRRHVSREQAAMVNGVAPRLPAAACVHPADSPCCPLSVISSLSAQTPWCHVKQALYTRNPPTRALIAAAHPAAAVAAPLHTRGSTFSGGCRRRA